eukprot:TRINITY_DN69593_c0_g1_i1.p1 TRINITY_DN69593_c0_g1~~TRINITY_DN69593_c0_g1_i1.p1  ORF type:complete len:178 (-),score=25.66 TRINITY_DN69593_c0_g1_i1:339-830(-)
MGATGNLADNSRLHAAIANRTETLRRAVRNYRRFAFVGIVGDIDASLELLRHRLGWRSAPTLGRLNANAGRSEATRGERRRLRQLLRALAPMDVWFFEYVRRDFAAQVAALPSAPFGAALLGASAWATAGRLVPETLPSETALGGCVSTRQAIACGPHVFTEK